MILDTNAWSAWAEGLDAVETHLRSAGRLIVPSIIPPNDVWIAALARQHVLPVLSNDAHFDVVQGIERIAF